MTAPIAEAVTTPDGGARPFRLGFLTHVHGPGRPADAVYRDLVEFFVAAEELGFDGGWVAQHHLRADYGRLPSPLVLLAAVAERTRRIELGTGIVVLPLEDPIRLAEDAAVLDTLSGGRLQLGLGSGGANVDAFTAFGRSADERHQRFAAGVRDLTAALRGDALPGGALLNPVDRGLADRLWHATSTETGAGFAAASGGGLLIGTAVHDPRTQQRPLVEAYLRAAERPRVGAVRAVFPARDRAAAAADLAPALEVTFSAFRRHGAPGMDVTDTAGRLARLNVHHGHPDEVVDSLRADPALFGYADWFLPVVSHEVSRLDDDIRRLETIATRIAPALGWRAAA